ncbi:MAG: ABC transporter permease, partial [Pirellulales bacterium]
MIPVAYNYRNLLVRWKTTCMTAGAFTLVVAAIVVILAFVSGVQSVCATSGQPENVLVLNHGSHDEVTSQLDSSQAIRIENTPGVLRLADGMLLASRELYMNLGHKDDGSGAYNLVQTRGVMPVAFQVHSQVRITSGRTMRRSQSEIIVGRGLQRQLDIQIGERFAIGPRSWTVVGIFDADGSTFETEVWANLDEMAGVIRREGVYSGIVLRTPSSGAAEMLVDKLTNARSLSVNAETESGYYARIAEEAEFLRTAGLVIAGFMAVGAVFGVMNTMFAAIGQRIKDIAVLRILGFRKGDILISFLLEAMLIAVLGGGAGLALGYALNGLSLQAIVGSKSVAFAFVVDSRAIATGTTFTL